MKSLSGKIEMTEAKSEEDEEKGQCARWIWERKIDEVRMQVLTWGAECEQFFEDLKTQRKSKDLSKNFSVEEIM